MEMSKTNFSPSAVWLSAVVKFYDSVTVLQLAQTASLDKCLRSVLMN